MTTKKMGFNATEAIYDEKNTDENKTRILIVDNDTVVRQKLIPLINRESDLLVCAEAEDANQALEAIETQQVDFAIVNIPPRQTGAPVLTEKIKLQCPSLPVLILSIHEESLHNFQALTPETQEDETEFMMFEKIITAIRYVQSLLKSQISGFSIFVKEFE
jgi:DNA-binding NarL/FixJ family response regulator